MIIEQRLEKLHGRVTALTDGISKMNPCHKPPGPAGGQFCSLKGGGAKGGGKGGGEAGTGKHNPVAHLSREDQIMVVNARSDNAMFRQDLAHKLKNKSVLEGNIREQTRALEYASGWKETFKPGTRGYKKAEALENKHKAAIKENKQRLSRSNPFD